MKQGALMPTLFLGAGAAVLLTLGTHYTLQERAFEAGAVPVAGHVVRVDAQGCPEIAGAKPEGGTFTMWSTDCTRQPHGSAGDRVTVLWNRRQDALEVQGFTSQWFGPVLLLGFGLLVAVGAVVASRIEWVTTSVLPR
jgi:hypothetical protein